MVYWAATAFFCMMFAKTRLDDSFNSPPVGVGYYAKKDRAEFEKMKPQEVEVEETADDYAKWR